jgi:multiple sugar transport system ATP-binding protein
MNLCRIRVDNGEAAISGLRIDVPGAVVASADGQEVTLGFRPESLEVAGELDEGLEVIVNVVEELGSDAFAYCALPGHDAALGAVDVVAKVDPRTPPKAGQRLRLRVRQDELHFFSARTGERLPN